MSKEIMQESTQIVECNAFHRGMSVLEANLRNTEDSESTISVLLKGAAEFYGASRASTPHTAETYSMRILNRCAAPSKEASDRC